MKFTSESFRQHYLHDLEFTGDPTHNRALKVRNIEHWKAILTSESLTGDPLIEIDLDDYSRDVWVWSDIHFGHKNIMKYSGRPYPSASLMNDCLIGNYLNVVKDRDIVIFGGDITFMNVNETNDILNLLPGYKIQIIGNHDIDRRGNLLSLAFNERHLCKIVDWNGTQLLFTHYPLDRVPDNCWNVHGHIHQHPAPSKGHVNICVEHTNYAPINLRELMLSQ